MGMIKNKEKRCPGKDGDCEGELEFEGREFRPFSQHPDPHIVEEYFCKECGQRWVVNADIRIFWETLEKNL